MKKLLIHVGPHKTGTTSIQTFLHREDEQLLKHGILYARSGRTIRESGIEQPVVAEEAHHNLAMYILDDVRADPTFGTVSDLLAEIAACPYDNVVISTEELARGMFHVENLKDFRETLLQNHIEPIILLVDRERSEYVRSLKFETVKNGFEGDLRDFEEKRVLETPLARLSLDIADIRESFVSIFGQEAFKEIDYSKTDVVVPFVDAMCSAFGVSNDFRIETVRVNSAEDTLAHVQAKLVKGLEDEKAVMQLRQDLSDLRLAKMNSERKLQQRIDDLELREQQLLASTSWKVTKPLRWLNHVVSRRRR